VKTVDATAEPVRKIRHGKPVPEGRFWTSAQIRRHFVLPDAEHQCHVCREPNADVVWMDHPHHVECLRKISFFQMTTNEYDAAKRRAQRIRNAAIARGAYN
jgi:hypothetical protein